MSKSHKKLISTQLRNITIRLYNSEIMKERRPQSDKNLLPYESTDRQQRIAELIQKRVWGSISPIRARITDQFEKPVSGYLLNAQEYLRLGGSAVIMADLIQNHLPSIIQANSEADLIQTLAATASHTALAYLLNTYPNIYASLLENYRLHPSSKLGLEANPITPDEMENDMRFCINGMNKNFEGMQLNLVNPESVVDNVYEFMDKLYGFHTKGTTRPKTPSRSSRLPYGSSGYFDKLSGEIVIVNPNNPHLLTHESFHSQGLWRESETEMATIVSLLTSEHPGLRYFGYSRWLTRLTQLMTQNENKGKIPNMDDSYYKELSERLKLMGLNDECIEFENQLRLEEEHLASIDHSGSLEKRVRKLEVRMAKAADRALGGRLYKNHLRKYTSAIAKSSYWYNLLPIALLHDYRVKYLS